MCKIRYVFCFATAVAVFGSRDVFSQEKSVNPGINDSFDNPDVNQFVERFEKEGREVYDQRNTIIEKMGLKPGMTVADVGCGTGLFTRLLSPAVGAEGKVYAVDIARNFVTHTVLSCASNGLKNVEGVVCDQDDVKLPEKSVDVVFICDTYHHFEFPHKTMTSIREALKPGGSVVVIDFERIPEKSSDWILNHVRAGKEEVIREIAETGLVKSEDYSDLFDENWFSRFTVPVYEDVTIEKAVQLLSDEKSEVKIIDVRTPREFQAGHIAGAKLADFMGDNFDEEIGKLDRNTPYLVHCAVGGRSGKSLEKFRELGFTKIYHLKDGFNGWMDAGKPVEK